MDDRREEFALLARLGATNRQVYWSVTAETGLVATSAAVLGSIASLATTVPFAIARHEGVIPNGQLWLPLVIAAATVAITVIAGVSAAVRTAQLPRQGGGQPSAPRSARPVAH